MSEAQEASSSTNFEITDEHRETWSKIYTHSREVFEWQTKLSTLTRELKEKQLQTDQTVRSYQSDTEIDEPERQERIEFFTADYSQYKQDALAQIAELKKQYNRSDWTERHNLIKKLKGEMRVPQLYTCSSVLSRYPTIEEYLKREDKDEIWKTAISYLEKRVENSDARGRSTDAESTRKVLIRYQGRLGSSTGK